MTLERADSNTYIEMHNPAKVCSAEIYIKCNSTMTHGATIADINCLPGHRQGIPGQISQEKSIRKRVYPITLIW